MKCAHPTAMHHSYENPLLSAARSGLPVLNASMILGSLKE